MTLPEKSLADLRETYMLAGLNEADLNPDPLLQFENWFEQAQTAGLREPNAMTLATASKSGVPSARVVLLKGLSADGFVFYTNYESQKAREMEENPHAALVFFWNLLERQVRVAGPVVRVSRAESRTYFESRPRGHRLGAWASHQSEVIRNRNGLEEALRKLETQYPGEEIPLPNFWGGYRVNPESIEFWQGRPNRLHDRLRYTRTPSRAWRIDRLSP